jgi:DNA-binding XRE family transcriptional regulator
MKYQYTQALAEQIPTIQESLPPIRSRDDLDVSTQAVPESERVNLKWTVCFKLIVNFLELPGTCQPQMDSLFQVNSQFPRAA